MILIKNILTANIMYEDIIKSAKYCWLTYKDKYFINWLNRHRQIGIAFGNKTFFADN